VAPVSDAAYRRAFLVILLTGFALRLIWAVLVPLQPTSDGQAYDELAWNLASTGSYAWNTGRLTAYWPVGTPFIYSLPFRLFGHAFAPLAAMNVLAGTAVLAMIVTVAKEWVPRPAALAAGALYAVWPSQIEFVSVLASELYFNLAVLLAMWAAFASPFRSWLVRGVVAGLFLAAASFIRPVALPLVAILPVTLIWTRRTRLKDLAAFTAAAAVVMALCIAPWALRNERVFGERVLISTNGRPVTWMGNNPAATGEYVPYPADVEGLNEVQRSHVLAQRARDFMLHHPVTTVELALKKLVLTHDRETIGIVWNEEQLAPAIGPTGILAAKLVSTFYWLAVLALAIAGAIMVLIRDRWRGLIHPALLTWAYFAALHAITLANDRYHMPSIPFIATLAGLAASALLSRWRASREPSSSAGETPAARARTTAG
jgi:4-amino-4-deoxy-L-arabinose transferase-like glycosyltransferase